MEYKTSRNLAPVARQRPRSANDQGIECLRPERITPGSRCKIDYTLLQYVSTTMTTTTPPAPGMGPTPPQEDQPASTYASYVPHDLAYNADFEDSLIAPVLNGPKGDASIQPEAGLRVIPPDSNEAPVSGVSVRASDISPISLPTIMEADLPLALNDPMRTFASPLPGVLLTHPAGYLEGGPPLNPSMDTFAEDFLSHRPNVSTPEELRRAVQKEIDANVEVLTERLSARRRAKEENDRLAKELKTMTDQHDMELKIQERMQEAARKKKEAKERERREKDGAGG